MGYHIGSFNIRDFNFSNQSRDGEKIGRDFEKIAEIIIKEKFDVVAIQEVNAEIAIKHLTNVLNKNKNLTIEWEYCYGAPLPGKTKDPEGYAFIWNNKRLRLLEVPRNNNPRLYQDAGGLSLLRPPFYARFTARGMFGGSNFELRLLNVHIRDAVKGEDRIKEFDVLVKQILPRCCDHQEVSMAGEIMPAYTFILGDYNICLNKEARAQFRVDSITESAYTGKRRYYKTVQEEPTSLRMPGNQKTIEECYANNYDHFTYEINLIEKMRLSERRVEGLSYYKSEKCPLEQLERYRKSVSDHVPICMEIDLKRT